MRLSRRSPRLSSNRTVIPGRTAPAGAAATLAPGLTQAIAAANNAPTLHSPRCARCISWGGGFGLDEPFCSRRSLLHRLHYVALRRIRRTGSANMTSPPVCGHPSLDSAWILATPFIAFSTALRWPAPLLARSPSWSSALTRVIAEGTLVPATRTGRRGLAPDDHGMLWISRRSRRSSVSPAGSACSSWRKVDRSSTPPGAAIPALMDGTQTSSSVTIRHLVSRATTSGRCRHSGCRNGQNHATTTSSL